MHAWVDQDKTDSPCPGNNIDSPEVNWRRRVRTHQMLLAASVNYLLLISSVNDEPGWSRAFSAVKLLRNKVPFFNINH